MDNRVCYRCGKRGHIGRDCPEHGDHRDGRTHVQNGGGTPFTEYRRRPRPPIRDAVGGLVHHRSSTRSKPRATSSGLARLLAAKHTTQMFMQGKSTPIRPHRPRRKGVVTPTTVQTTNTAAATFSDS